MADRREGDPARLVASSQNPSRTRLESRIHIRKNHLQRMELAFEIGCKRDGSSSPTCRLETKERPLVSF